MMLTRHALGFEAKSESESSDLCDSLIGSYAKGVSWLRGLTAGDGTTVD